MRVLEHRVPPPIVFLIVAAAMWLAPSMRDRTSEAPRIVAAAALCGLGLSAAVAGFLAFRRARTTTNPVRPEAASALVTGGIYRVTRNPMYLGLTLLLLGWTVFLAAPWALLGPVAFVFFITRFQIMPEEHVLEQKFATAYRDYRATVRRWL